MNTNPYNDDDYEDDDYEGDSTGWDWYETHGFDSYEEDLSYRDDLNGCDALTGEAWDTESDDESDDESDEDDDL